MLYTKYFIYTHIACPRVMSQPPCLFLATHHRSSPPRYLAVEVAVGSKIPTILWGQKPDRRAAVFHGRGWNTTRDAPQNLLRNQMLELGGTEPYWKPYLTLFKPIWKPYLTLFKVRIGWYWNLPGICWSRLRPREGPMQLAAWMFWAVQPLIRYNQDQRSLMENLRPPGATLTSYVYGVVLLHSLTFSCIWMPPVRRTHKNLGHQITMISFHIMSNMIK